jgi:hypothetical protein
MNDQMIASAEDAVRDIGNELRGRHGKAVMTGGQNTTSGIIRSVSRLCYSTAYALAFGIVYPTVFLTEMLPRDNAVMDGFSDGSRDAVEAVKNRPEHQNQPRA